MVEPERKEQTQPMCEKDIDVGIISQRLEGPSSPMYLQKTSLRANNGPSRGEIHQSESKRNCYNCYAPHNAEYKRMLSGLVLDAMRSWQITIAG